MQDSEEEQVDYDYDNEEQYARENVASGENTTSGRSPTLSSPEQIARTSNTGSIRRTPIPMPASSMVVPSRAVVPNEVQDELDRINAIQDGDARNMAFRLYMEKCELKRSLDQEMARTNRQATSTGSLEAREPPTFDGKDKTLKFKSWAKVAKHYFDIKGQAENTHVSSAISWLEGPALSQAQLLMEAQPAHTWPYDVWVNAMQDSLYQTDPITEARTVLHHAKLVGDSNFPAFASKFQHNLAILQQDDASRMSVPDQIFLFRRGLENTAYHHETEVDPSTNKAYTSLTAMMDRCRSVYQGRFFYSNNAAPAGGARGGFGNRGRGRSYMGGSHEQSHEGGSPGYQGGSLNRGRGGPPYRGRGGPSRGFNGGFQGRSGAPQNFGNRDFQGGSQGGYQNQNDARGGASGGRYNFSGGARGGNSGRGSALNHVAGRVEPATPAMSQMQDIQCFQCKNWGHMRGDCPMNVQQQQHQQPPYDGNKRPRYNRQASSLTDDAPDFHDFFQALFEPTFSSPPFSVEQHPSRKVVNPRFAKRKHGGQESKVMPDHKDYDAEPGTSNSHAGHSDSVPCLNKKEFQKLERATGMKFELDGGAINSLHGNLRNSCDVERFLEKDVSGRHTFICPPFSKIEAVLKHYRDCKARDQENTSICILVPAWQNEKWRPLLRSFTLMREYRAGSKVFESRSLQIGTTPRALR